LVNRNGNNNVFNNTYPQIIYQNNQGFMMPNSAKLLNGNIVGNNMQNMQLAQQTGSNTMPINNLVYGQQNLVHKNGRS